MQPPNPLDPLSRTLGEWRITPARAPNFRADVWRRISGVPRETWASYVRSHVGAWSLAAVLALSAGGWAGRTVAQVRLANEREAMVVAYLVDLDPRVQAKVRQ